MTRVSRRERRLGELGDGLLGAQRRVQSSRGVARLHGPQGAFVGLHGEPVLELGA